LIGCALTGLEKDQPISTRKRKKSRKTSEMMEGFCFVISITGLNGPNTGKEDDGRNEIRVRKG
jgi:hypothetical protein